MEKQLVATDFVERISQQVAVAIIKLIMKLQMGFELSLNFGKQLLVKIMQKYSNNFVGLLNQQEKDYYSVQLLQISKRDYFEERNLLIHHYLLQPKMDYFELQQIISRMG